MPALTATRVVPGAGVARAPIRVLIVDDSIVARAVIARTIDAEPDLEVVAQAGSARAALEILAARPVDAILLDLEMPGGGGLEALPALIAAGGEARVLIVSSAAATGAEATVTALRLGAADTLLKPTVGFGNAFGQTLIDRLRRLAHDAVAAPPAHIVSIAPDETVTADGEVGCVAIGASTGGVHALAAFFGAYPATVAAPILVTQHLPAPFMTHFARQLADMAGRPVTVAADGMPVRAGTILLAPGDASLSLLRTRGLVHVKLERTRGVSGCLPSVDPMFAATALLYGSAAVGVVLSGMGRDGLIGARALHEAGGTVLAQDAASSVIWGMPGAVVQATLAKSVLPPAQLAQRIGIIASKPAEGASMEMSPIAASAFAGLLERATGQQLVPGRRWRIATALGPVMRARGVDSLDHLAAMVRGADHSAISGEVVEALLNHETFFFRDIGAFQMLASEALPALAAAREGQHCLRIWSAGCSTGQEAYSLVLAIARQRPRWTDWRIEILGTDISRQAVAKAREGLYSQFEIQRGLPIGDMLSYFEPEGESWRAAPALREQVAFRQHNLLDVPPPGRFDLVLCRNVLLYFSPERRRAVLERLAQSMAPDGMLILGAGETVLGQSDAFDPDQSLRGVYRLRVKGAR